MCVQALTETDPNKRAYAVWVSEIMLQQVNDVQYKNYMYVVYITIGRGVMEVVK